MVVVLQVWYCVSPADADKFDELTRQLFPDAYARCPAFMRHKDVLVSPKMMSSHGIKYMQVRARDRAGRVGACAGPVAGRAGAWQACGQAAGTG